MRSNSLDRDFTVSEAALAADVDVETLRSWLKRGKFSISTETRKWARLSFVELCQVAVFAEIVASEGGHTLAQFVAEGSAAQFAQIVKSTELGEALPAIYVLCGRDVDGGGNQIGGIVFNTEQQIAKRVTELLSSDIAFFQIINLTSVFTRVSGRVSR